MSKMTLWFPPHIKPVHKGVYETKDLHKLPRTLPTYARWNGLEWSNESYWTHHPELHYTSYGASQKKHWRGFTKEHYGASQNKLWRGFKEKQT